MAEKESAQIKKQNNGGKKEDWDITPSILDLVKNVSIYCLGDFMKTIIGILILAGTTILFNLTIYIFKSHLKNEWKDKTKWSIIILVLFAYTIIPLGFRVILQENKNKDLTMALDSNYLTQTVQAEQINKLYVNQTAMQATIDFQATQLITQVPISAPTEEQLVEDSIMRFMELINKGQTLIAYDTLFTDDFRERNSPNDFEKYWGTDVDQIRIDITVFPQINLLKGISDTEIDISISHEGDPSSSVDFTWIICHYRSYDETWLIDKLDNNGSCW
ncbi:MAG TPA: hypothetical protein G4N92_02755 [Anaerolineae bacterium]|nr:hypothetical protein [Anaerolineae bacterium]